MSTQYCHYLSSSDIAAIASNRRGYNSLKSCLIAKGGIIEHETLYGEFITVSAPIKNWESFFSTKFALYKHFESEKKIFRAPHYTLHESIADHVIGVFNLIHFPMNAPSGPVLMLSQREPKRTETLSLHRN